MLRFARIPSLARVAAAAALLLAGSLLPSSFADPAAAQQKNVPGLEPNPKTEPQKKQRRSGAGSIPGTGRERALLLDELYAHLATAASEEAAQRTSEAIEHVWLRSGSDTVNLLMERSLKAVNDKKPALALKLLDNVVELAPDYPEGWSRRAYVHYTRNDFERSLGDLRRVLALDPNHFKALDGLAQILREIEQKKAALQVYRRLLEVHPFMSGAKSAVDELSRELEGQGI